MLKPILIYIKLLPLATNCIVKLKRYLQEHVGATMSHQQLEIAYSLF